MSETVSAFQVGAFSDPQNGQQPIDADQVRANDDALRTKFNAHDADATTHFQSSVFASRPAAGTAGRKWFSSDTKQIFRDNGSSWDEINYLNLTSGGTVAGATTFSGGLTSTAGSRTFGATTFSGTISGTAATFSSTISAAGATLTGALTGTSGSFTGALSVGAGATISAGGLTVLAGGIVVSGSGMNITGTSFLNSVIATGTGSFSGTLTAGNAVSSGTTSINGQYRIRDDSDTLRWFAGITQTASARDYLIYDVVNSAARLTINASTGAATFSGTVAVTSGIVTFAGLTGTAKVIGATSGINIRDNSDANTNVGITNAGNVTVRGSLTVGGTFSAPNTVGIARSAAIAANSAEIGSSATTVTGLTLASLPAGTWLVELVAAYKGSASGSSPSVQLAASTPANVSASRYYNVLNTTTMNSGTGLAAGQVFSTNISAGYGQFAVTRWYVTLSDATDLSVQLSTSGGGTSSMAAGAYVTATNV